MYEQMDEATDRCWAFNKAGQRCEMVAGHDREHNVIIAWGPDECWVPGVSVTIVGGGGGGGGIAPAPEPEKIMPPAVCVMCEHPDHRGKCGREDSDGFACDCSEGIPA